MDQDLEQFAQYLHRRYGDRSTGKHYVSDLQVFMRLIGSKQAQEVTAQDIDRFVADQVKRGLRPATINRRVAALHTFFEFLASLEPDQSWPNPVHWRRHGVKQGQTVPRDALDGQVDRLFAVIEDVRDRAMFGLMVGAGLRVGEVVTLRYPDLEPPPTPTEGARLRVCGKGRKERIVWLTPYWYTVLSVWLTQRPPAESDHLFLNQHQRPLSVAGIQFRLKQYCRQADIDISCHQLRHTFARRLADQSMPIESISALLGHAQVETTQRYTAGANPGLRDAFLATMASLETSSAPAPATPVSAPAPPARRDVADIQSLEQTLQRLASLPDWLRETLCDYIRRRWQDWQPHRAPENAQKLAGQLLQTWRWLVTECSLHSWSDLRRSHVEAWLTARTEAGLAASSRRSELSILFSSLHFALDQDRDVAASIFRVPSPAHPKPLPRYLPADQYQCLLATVLQQTACATPKAALDRAWFLTLAHTGIRTSELLNLRLSDLDFTTHRLFIRSGKSGHERVVYLTAALANALAHYLAHRPVTTDDHLWVEDGKPLSTNKMRSRFQHWAETAQVPATPHRLRHTLATQLINAGMPLNAIAKLLGHRTLDMTQHYARLYEQTVKEQFEAAIAQIEGIAVTGWPQPSLQPQPQIEQLVDSV
jgi:site-specific recombinase XerD